MLLVDTTFRDEQEQTLSQFAGDNLGAAAAAARQQVRRTGRARCGKW